MSILAESCQELAGIDELCKNSTVGCFSPTLKLFEENSLLGDNTNSRDIAQIDFIGRISQLVLHSIASSGL